MGLALLAGNARADGTAHVVQKFDGTEINKSTSTFTVQDKWEVLWFSPRPIDITLLTSDGTVVAGIHGVGKGSFYEAKGGTYYFQLNGAHPEMKAPWFLTIAEVGGGTILAGADTSPMFSNPADSNYVPPDSVLPPGSMAQSSQGNVSSGPNGAQSPLGSPAPAASATTATPSPAPATHTLSENMSEDQARAREELAYRKALKNELNSYGDNIERLGALPRTNN